jgi:membrane protein required for colicin V production
MMNILDISIIVIICFTTIMGIVKGMLRQLFTLAGAVGGYFAAKSWHLSVAGFMPSLQFHAERVISFAAIFLFVMILASVLSWALAKTFKSIGLGWFNRAGGGAVGFLKGFLVVAVASMVLLTFMPGDSGTIRTSVLLPYVISGLKAAKPVIPKAVSDGFMRKIDGPAKKQDTERQHISF